MKTEILNCTPHEVSVLNETGEIIATFPSSGILPRLSTKTEIVGKIGNEIPLTETVFGKCENLPKLQAGTFLIVSRMILSALPNREDLLVPNEMVRNEKGHIIGCKSLARK